MPGRGLITSPNPISVLLNKAKVKGGVSLSHFPWPVKVSKNGRFFVDAKGDPFFWLGDTAWPLLTAYPLKEAERYLVKRAAQGFTVIQTAIPWQHGGTHSGTIFKGRLPGANPFGETAWKVDPSKPNPKFF